MDFLQQLDQLSDDNKFNESCNNNDFPVYDDDPLTETPPITGNQSRFSGAELHHSKFSRNQRQPATNNSFMFQGIQSVDVAETSMPANHSVYTEMDSTGDSTSNITYYSDASTAAVISTSVLTNKGRSAFKFQHFNKMQSKCYPNLYNSDYNCIISSPTGSGKTVLFELAILRLLMKHHGVSNIKILYIAPTKALCLEREKDWISKFSPFGLSVGVLTSDTSLAETETVKRAQIIISTPEKWDLMTRRWTDYSKLFDMIKLLLIDEIQILRDNRGSTLEVVVTRMKKICLDIRIIALSATLPNINDVSSWIKLNSSCEANALTMVFGDEYRPVKLEKVVYGYKQATNDFVFDSYLNAKLVEVLNEHSLDKPVLVFCPTRNSTISTAKYLATNLKASMSLRPSKNMIRDRELSAMVPQGVAYHHAGLSIDDRSSVEKNFIGGTTKILCSTSTLAVGVNLPAYLVVIKGTKIWNIMQFEEYSELDILQMMGRAGRPQFETEGKAVLMTNSNEKYKYESLVKGNQKIESKLHLNLPQHLVSEIYLKTITSLEDAITWLKHTFFYARYRSNPTAYNEIPDLPKADMDTRLQAYCEQILRTLIGFGIIEIKDGQYQSTAYGDAMTRHYIDFETMKTFLKVQSTLSVSDVLLLISKSKEFNTIRLRRNEKKLFKMLNESPILKYPLKSDKKSKNLDHGYEKVYLTVQYELGGQEFPTDPNIFKLQQSFKQDKFFIFKHFGRLARCLVDIHVNRRDFVSLKNSLLVLRCVNAGCWEESPVVLKQLNSVGLAAVRRFTNQNIRSFQQLRELEPGKIEYYGSLRPGNGYSIKEQLNTLPVLKVNAGFVKAHKARGEEKVMAKVGIELTVECSSQRWKGRNISINVLSGLSTGEMVDFRRSFISKILGKKSFNIDFEVPSAQSELQCYITCEDIAGVGDHTVLNLFENLAPNLAKLLTDKSRSSQHDPQTFAAHRSPTSSENPTPHDELDKDDEDDLDDLLLVASSKKQREKTHHPEIEHLEKGMVKCRHACKDKTKCRHLCCREGLPPPKSKTIKKPQKKRTLMPVKESGSIQKVQTKSKPEHKLESNPQGAIENSSENLSRSNASQNTSGYSLLQRLHKNTNTSSTRNDLASFRYEEISTSASRSPVNNLTLTERRTNKSLQKEKSDTDFDSDFDDIIDLLRDVNKRKQTNSVPTKRPNESVKEIVNIESSPRIANESFDTSSLELHPLKKSKYDNDVYGGEPIMDSTAVNEAVNESNTTFNETYNNIEEVNHEYQIAKAKEIEELREVYYENKFEQLLKDKEYDANDDDLQGIFGSDVDIV